MNYIKNAMFGVLAASMVVGVIAPVASAQTTADLQAQIAALLAQVNALTSQLNAQGSVTVSASFTRDLTVGSTGSDVKALQQFLNAKGYVVASSGAGAPGSESTYFGSKTKVALAKFQAANGISPAVGYFGPKTRAAVIAMIGTGSGSGSGNGNGNGGGTPAPAGTSLSVGLASDNAPAGSLVAGAARVPVLAVNLTAGTGSAVNISSIAFHKTGVVSDSNISGAYLVQGGKVVAQYSSLSNGVITFSGLNWQIPAGTTQEVWLAVDVSTGSSAGNTVAFSLTSASDITATAAAGGSVVPTGSFPVNGNNFTVTTVSNPSLATMTITSSTVGSQVNAGDQNVLVSQWNVNVANSAVKLGSINFRVVGSANKSDLKNVKLYINGTQVGNTLPSVSADGSAYFDLSGSPARLNTGNSNVQIFADIAGSPSYNFQFELLNTYDVYAIDTQYNVPVTVTVNGNAGTQVTINQGQLTVTLAADTPTGNVAKGQSAVTIAKFKIYAAGEAVRVKFLDFQITMATSSAVLGSLSTQIRNVSLIDDAGQQVGSTISTPPTANSCQTVGTAGITGNVYSDCFGTSASPINYVVPANTTRVLSLKADIQSTANFSSITGKLAGNTSNLQGLTSSQLANSASVSGSALSLASSALTIGLNTSFGTQTVTTNATAQKIGSYAFTASSAEGVNVNNVTITSGSSAATTTQNLMVKVNGAQFGTTYSTLSSNSAYTFSGTPFVVPAGQTVNVDVYADILSSAVGTMTPGSSLTGCTGTGAISFSSISCSGTVSGQALTIGGAPAITVAADSSNPPVGQLVMGATQVPLAAFRLTETSNVENVKVTDLNIFQSTAAGSKSAFNNITLYNGATAVGTAGSAVSSTNSSQVTGGGGTGYYYPVHFTTPVVVPKAGSLTLTLKGDVSSYTSNGATDNATSTFRIVTSTDAANDNAAGTETVVALGQSSNQAATVTLSSANGNQQRILRSNLTVTAAALGASSGRAKSTVDDIGTLTFTASNAGAVVLNTVTTTITGTLPTSTFASNYTAGGSGDVELYDTQTGLTVGTASSSACTSGGTCTFTFQLGAGTAGYVISAGSSKTFSVRVDSFDHVTPGASGISLTLSAQIKANTDVTYTDATDGSAVSSINLPTTAVPLTVNAVSYAQGT